MLDTATVTAWLDAYVHAWKTYDRRDIGALFSEQATYAYDPFNKPVRGRAAIVEMWLENRDEPGTYDGHYEPILIEDNRAVTNGRSLYYKEDGTISSEWDNIFILRFDDEGRCAEYREWYMKRP